MAAQWSSWRVDGVLIKLWWCDGVVDAIRPGGGCHVDDVRGVVGRSRNVVVPHAPLVYRPTPAQQAVEERRRVSASISANISSLKCYW